MMLVVDVVKGVQTQTAECLLIGELTCPRMVVVLNKIDLLPPNKRQSAIEKMTKRLHKTLESTRSAIISKMIIGLHSCIMWSHTLVGLRGSQALAVITGLTLMSAPSFITLHISPSVSRVSLLSLLIFQ